MAKKPKKEEKKAKDEPFNVFDMSWVDERAKEVDEEFATYDAATDPVLKFRWKGKYTVRFLPCLRGEWMKRGGFHFNVIATGDEGDSGVMVPCISAVGRDCPICAAVNKGLAEGRLTKDHPIIKGDKQGKGTVRPKIVGFSRILLVDFKVDSSESKAAPKFGEFPVARVGQFPRKLVKYFNGFLRDQEYGKEAFFDLDSGLSWTFTAGVEEFWWSAPRPSRKPYPVPEEFRDPEFITGFYDMDRLTITQTEQDIMNLLEKNQNNVPEALLNEILTLDVGSSPSKPELASDRLKKLREEHRGRDEEDDED